MNRLGREIRRETRNLDGSFSYVNTAYNDLGLVASLTRPSLVGSPPAPASSFFYDPLGRLKARARAEDGADPAQTRLIHEDMNVGVWEEQKISGAFPAAEQKRLLERVEKLQAAVKRAREAANLVEAPNKEVGAKLFGWLFK